MKAAPNKICAVRASMCTRILNSPPTHCTSPVSGSRRSPDRCGLLDPVWAGRRYVRKSGKFRKDIAPSKHGKSSRPGLSIRRANRFATTSLLPYLLFPRKTYCSDKNLLRETRIRFLYSCGRYGFGKGRLPLFFPRREGPPKFRRNSGMAARAESGQHPLSASRTNQNL